MVESEVCMSKELVMGNAAIAYGAIKAGVNVVAGYPGTPSTEVLETVAKHNPGDIYVEWSVNEKAALEVAAGAAYSGARVMVTMKQVGLNVATDPLMSLNYVGIKGGMVVMVADDPGPISSQTEQDTRHFAQFAKMMVFDPSSPKEAYEMIQDAFEYSEKYGKPVLFRPTTRVCHGYQTIDLSGERYHNQPEGFVKDTMRWVIFPRTSYLNHIKLEKMMVDLSDDFSNYRYNQITGGTEHNHCRKGIAASGVSYEYVKEVIGNRSDIKLFKVATANPFPEKLTLKFLEEIDEVLVFEELDPVVERELTYICGKYHINNVKVLGKLTGNNVTAGENTVAQISKNIADFLGDQSLCMDHNQNQTKNNGNQNNENSELSELPELPTRPPVLCAGCPHRASFYAVKCAMKGKKAVFCGDIGCYTLGNARPLDMCDTCLCMGADVTMTQGIHRIEPNTYNFAFIGDSTFFASGMTGIVNAVYNQAEMTLIVLDNSTTAMTGHQPHPGTGVTMMGDIVNKVSIEKILKAIGIETVVTADPLKLDQAIDTVKNVVDQPGVKAIIFKSPCVAVTRPSSPVQINTEKCVNCKKCINEIGCPAIVLNEGHAFIEPSQCFGCKVCTYICPKDAIEEGGKRS